MRNFEKGVSSGETIMKNNLHRKLDVRDFAALREIAEEKSLFEALETAFYLGVDTGVRISQAEQKKVK